MVVTATQGQAVLNGHLMLNAVDISDQTYSWRLPVSIGSSPITTPGNKGTYHTPGNESWMLDVVFWDDQADGGITSALYAILGTKVVFVVRPDKGVIGTSNPQWDGECWITGEFVALQAPEDGGAPQIACSFAVHGIPVRTVA